MKAIQKRYHRFLALLLSFMLLFSQSGVSAFAEGESSPTDLQPAVTEPVTPSESGDTDSPPASPDEPDPAGDQDEPAPFQQTETISNIRFTVTAKPGVLSEGESLSIVSIPDDADFREDALAVLDVQPSGSQIISHAFWSFTVPELNGSVSVRMDGLGLSGLMEENPEGELSVYLLRQNPEGSTPKERAVRHVALIHPDQDYLTFDLKESAVMDLVTILKLPESEPEEDVRGGYRQQPGGPGEPDRVRRDERQLQSVGCRQKKERRQQKQSGERDERQGRQRPDGGRNRERGEHGRYDTDRGEICRPVY